MRKSLRVVASPAHYVSIGELVITCDAQKFLLPREIWSGLLLHVGMTIKGSPSRVRQTFISSTPVQTSGRVAKASDALWLLSRCRTARKMQFTIYTAPDRFALTGWATHILLSREERRRFSTKPLS